MPEILSSKALTQTLVGTWLCFSEGGCYGINCTVTRTPVLQRLPWCSVCERVSAELGGSTCEIHRKHLYSTAVCWDHPVTKDSGASSWISAPNPKAAVSSVHIHRFVMYFNTVWGHIISKYCPLCKRTPSSMEQGRPRGDGNTWTTGCC